MKDLNEDGAKAVRAAEAPWAMKYSFGHPYTHRKYISDWKKTTEQSPPIKAHIITSVGNLSISVPALQPPCKRSIAHNSHDCRCSAPSPACSTVGAE